MKDVETLMLLMATLFGTAAFKEQSMLCGEDAESTLGRRRFGKGSVARDKRNARRRRRN